MLLNALTLVSVAALVSADAIEGLVGRASVGASQQLCGYITVEFNLGPFVTNNKLSICICESGIADLVTGGNNNILNAAVLIFGQATVESTLLSALQNSKNSNQCTFPAHSTPACTSKDVCAYDCTAGYQKCNNQCQTSCPSGRSLPEKRDLAYWGKQIQRNCKPGWKACGIPGGGPRDWECVDIKNDLWSCGDCPVDIMFSHSGSPGLGVDCSAISGVADVGCVAGRCIVNKCMPGYKVSQSGHHCEADDQVISRPPLQIIEAATSYVLEHMPLPK
ncbi:hypothetical protein GYMLUDRAFT_34723 [Collybiopsis luxurians FD-317 M1]|nr:hypothetical protein GYMLUDRAFT_34723 [Collybiopsis luxurians FD-317 M1]